MRKIPISLTFFLAITLLMSVFVFAAPVGADITYKIEGYITDSNGNPIAGAHLIFNNLTVPSAQTDQQGYYSTYAAVGTYRLNVWPPYNSNYINYDEQGYTVSAAATKNITLATGCKVSGCVVDQWGIGMKGASVLFKVGSTVYGSGYFTDATGYYYAAVPTGTYTIDAHPQTAYDPTYQGPCTQFQTYIESNYAVYSNINRNITVEYSSSTNKITVSGFILDENGNGIEGARISFNTDDTVPNIISDNTGHYAVSVSGGTYNVNVWPPFDSDYVRYSEYTYTVNSDAFKNITLPTGFKVSGYITNTQGNPVSNVNVQVGDYISGWFSNSSGYYFVVVPEGVYTITAQRGTYLTENYDPYTENDFGVYANTDKNITLLPEGSTPSPEPTASPTPAPTTQPTPNPTSTPASTSTLTIQTEASNYQVGSTLTIKGTLTNQNNNYLTDKTITLSYSADDTEQWTIISSTQTDAQGQYSLQWFIPASGTFTLKAQWTGDQTNQAVQSTTTVSFVAATGKQVFFVQSNSTITNLSFNTTSHTLTFAATGPDDSTGQTEVTISKTLVEDATAFAVALDGKQLQFGITDMGDNWVLTFSYHHSSHIITVDLAASAKDPAINGVDISSNMLLIAIPLAVGVCLAAGLLLYKRRSKP